MQADLNKMFTWAEKWRLKFNVENVKVCTLEIKTWRMEMHYNMGRRKLSDT